MTLPPCARSLSLLLLALAIIVRATIALALLLGQVHRVLLLAEAQEEGVTPCAQTSELTSLDSSCALCCTVLGITRCNALCQLLALSRWHGAVASHMPP